MSVEYTIAETETFQKELKRPEVKRVYGKIVNYVYPQLRKNPHFGLNIKKLKGELDQFYRYRIGKHRLFYQIDDNRVLVFIITLRDRKDAYRQ